MTDNFEINERQIQQIIKSDPYDETIFFEVTEHHIQEVISARPYRLKKGYPRWENLGPPKIQGSQLPP